MKKGKKIFLFVKDKAGECAQSRYAMPIALTALVVLLHSNGFCDVNSSTNGEMDTMATTTINTIFAPWVRKTALGFGAGFGLFKAYMGGSIMPLLTWGGLGLAVNYVPKLINYITALGG